MILLTSHSWTLNVECLNNSFLTLPPLSASASAQPPKKREESRRYVLSISHNHDSHHRPLNSEPWSWTAPHHCWCVFFCSFFVTSNICLYYVDYHHLSTQRRWKWLETCVNDRSFLFFFSFTVLTRIYNEIHYNSMNVQQPHHQHLSKRHNQYSSTWHVATNTTFTLRWVATLPCHL